MHEDTTKTSQGDHSFFRNDPRKPLASTPGLEPGKVVGDFKLGTLLGQGGMGQVWEATQVSLARQVAVKFVRPERVTDHQLELFAREARAGGRLSHSGIVAVYGHGESDGLAWIAMELVPGAWDLRDFLDEATRMAELSDGYDKKVAQFVAETADAVHAAHEAGVVHRDLKPQNILITESDRPKVTDFGLARIVDEQALSRTGDFAGTYFYMSPEQVAAKRAGLDHRTDVFSLGVVLYEMLCLQRPFQGDTEHQIAEQILIKEPPALRTIRSKIPRDLAVICGKAMEKDRDKRYQTMGDLAADLRRWLSNEPIQATPPTVIDRAVKWARRNPTKSTTAALSIVAVFALFWLGFDLAESNEALKTSNSALIATTTESELQSDRARAAEMLANQRSYSASLYACQMALESGNIREARRLLELCPEDNRDWEWYHLRLNIDSSLHVLAGHTDGVTAMAWSPDGTKIVSASNDNTLRIWDAEGGDCLHVLRGHLGPVNTVSWSPDGTQIVSGSDDKSLRIWSAFNGQCTRVLSGHSEPVTSVGWGGSNGLKIASSDQSKQVQKIRIWDSESGVCRQLLEGAKGEVLGLAWSPNGKMLASIPVRRVHLNGSVGKISSPTFSDNAVHIWDVEKGLFERIEPDLDSLSVGSLAWSPDSTLICMGLNGGAIEIWDAQSRKRSKLFDGHDGAVTDVDWSRDGTQILSASVDRSLRVWSLETGYAYTLLTSEKGIANAEWNSANDQVAVNLGNDSLRIWSAAAGDNPNVLAHAGGGYRVTSLAASPDGTRLVSSSLDAFIRIWDLTSGECLKQMRARVLSSLAWDPSGDRFVSGSGNFGREPMRIWDSQTGEILNELDEFEGIWNPVVWSSNGVLIASVTGIDKNVSESVGIDGDSPISSIRIWNSTSGNSSQAFNVRGGVSLIDWNPDSNRLVSYADFGSIEIRDALTGECLREITVKQDCLNSLAWSPNGQMIASGFEDRTLRVWDAETGELIGEFEGHDDGVLSVDWSPSSTRIVSGSKDGTLRIWSAKSGECLLVLKGHEAAVVDVEWSVDGNRIFSSADDSTVRIWETRLVDALPIWRNNWLTEKRASLVKPLFQKCSSLAEVRAAIRANASLTNREEEEALKLALSMGEVLAASKNEVAWPLVDPDRDNPEADVVHGLLLAKEACLFDPTSPNSSDTLAWAFFANDMYVEAVAESKRAFGLAEGYQKASFEASLNRLHELIAAVDASAAPVK